MPTLSAQFKVTGMTCDGCERSIKNILTKIPGVAKADVSFKSGQVSVEFEGAQVGVNTLMDKVRRGGYGVQLWTEN